MPGEFHGLIRLVATVHGVTKSQTQLRDYFFKYMFTYYFLETEIATHSSILASRIPWTEEHGGYSPWGHKESDMTE